MEPKEKKKGLYPPLNLPATELKISQATQTSRPTVLCKSRNRRVTLTPEEWVRQHFIAYMTEVLGFPQGLVAAEKSIDVNGQPQRADIVAYSREMEPLMIVECKAPQVTLSQTTLNQALRYFSQIGSRAIVLTNGMQHYCVLKTKDGYTFAKEMPTWTMLTSEQHEK